MKCLRCKTRLSITHTYEAGDVGRTQTAKCPSCNKVYTIISIIEEASHGKGAYARAQGFKKNPPSASKVE